MNTRNSNQHIVCVHVCLLSLMYHWVVGDIVRLHSVQFWSKLFIPWSHNIKTKQCMHCVKRFSFADLLCVRWRTPFSCGKWGSKFGDGCVMRKLGAKCKLCELMPECSWHGVWSTAAGWGHGNVMKTVILRWQWWIVRNEARRHYKRHPNGLFSAHRSVVLYFYLKADSSLEFIVGFHEMAIHLQVVTYYNSLPM